MTPDPAAVLIAAVFLSLCEPLDEGRRWTKEPAFVLGLIVTAAIATAVSWDRRGSWLARGVDIVAFGAFFSAGYYAGRRMRRARPQGLLIAVGCIAVDVVAHLVFQTSGDTPRRFGGIALWGGAVAYTLVAGGSLVRLRRRVPTGEMPPS